MGVQILRVPTVALATIGIAIIFIQGVPTCHSAFSGQPTPPVNQAESDHRASIARHIIFSGRVQGVGFRNKTRSIASNRKLTGFVRNLKDGTVEMLVQGKTEDVEACLKDIKEFFKENIRETKIGHVLYDSKYADFRVLY